MAEVRLINNLKGVLYFLDTPILDFEIKDRELIKADDLSGHQLYPYELAMLGIPSIAMAQNKREEKHGFVCNENGFSYIGLNPADEIIESNLQMYLKMSRKSRQHFQDLLLSHDLRGGRKRVMSLINSL